MYLPTYRKQSRLWLLAILFLLFLTRSIQLPEIRAQQKPDLRENGFYVMRLPQIGKAKEYHSPKKGLAGIYYPQPTDFCGDAELLKASWVYDWNYTLSCDNGIETVAMLWCNDGAGLTIQATSDYLLEMNEPNQEDQCNITPRQGAMMIRRIEINHPGYKYVSPAPSHNGINWLSEVRDWYHQFHNEHPDEYPNEYPDWDALAMHCYAASVGGVAWCKQNLQQYREWVTKWNVPNGIWITELAFTPYGDYTEQDALRDESQWLDELNRDPFIRRYARFTNRWNKAWMYCPGCIIYRMIDDDDNLLNAGKVYRSK